MGEEGEGKCRNGKWWRRRGGEEGRKGVRRRSREQKKKSRKDTYAHQAIHTYIPRISTYIFNWVATVAHHLTLTEVFPECMADSLPVSLPVHLTGQHSTVRPPALSLPEQQQLSAARSRPTLQTQLPVVRTTDCSNFVLLDVSTAKFLCYFIFFLCL